MRCKASPNSLSQCGMDSGHEGAHRWESVQCDALNTDGTLRCIRDGNPEHAHVFLEDHIKKEVPLRLGQPGTVFVANQDVRIHNVEEKETAVREENDSVLPYMSLSMSAIKRVALIGQEGEKKYGYNNWRKGLKWSNTFDHLMSHLFLYLNGDRSEDHLAKAAWGLMAVMEYEKTHPELNDLQ